MKKKLDCIAFHEVGHAAFYLVLFGIMFIGMKDHLYKFFIQYKDGISL